MGILNTNASNLGREERVQVYGSPSYAYGNDVNITTTSGWIVAFDETDSEQKWLPFDQTRVINSSNVDIWFYPNQNADRKRLVKSNSELVLTDDRINRWKVVTVSGSITTNNEVRVECQATATTVNKEVRQDLLNPLSKLKSIGSIAGVFM